MKRFFGKFAVLLLALIMCFSVCLLASCENGSGDKDGDETTDKQNDTPAKNYEVKVESNFPLGEVAFEAKSGKDGGTLYEFVVTPKVGYAVQSFKVDGTEVALADNKAEYVLKQDATVTVEYCRKNSAELQRRQQLVVDKITQYVDTYFKYDKDYTYNLGSREIVLKAGKLHGGLPYTAYSSISPDVFLDFAISKDNKGIYTLSFPMGYDPFYWGGSCGNASYWAWAAISPTIRFSYSRDMIEQNGVYPVGVWEYDPTTDIKGGLWQDTVDICNRNTIDVMAEAYAMMNKGDAMQYNSEAGGNHVVTVTEVRVIKNKNGKVNPQNSFIRYSDQHGGYKDRTGHDGTYVYSSCDYNTKLTFAQVFKKGYLPMTCIELLDDSTPIAKAEFKESVEASKLNKRYVTSGYVETNYAITKVVMVITDANGAEVYKATRYGLEHSPARLAYSLFTSNDYKNKYDKVEHTGTYNDKLDLTALPTGKLRCVVTAHVSNGESSVVRDFTFDN